MGVSDFLFNASIAPLVIIYIVVVIALVRTGEVISIEQAWRITISMTATFLLLVAAAYITK